jgi:hypothetical protein
MADKQPTAQTRITRTPVYQTIGDDWPDGKAAEYDPATKRITVLGFSNARKDIPHESAHALFDAAGLAPASGQLTSQGPGLSLEARSLINYFPQLYKPLAGFDPAEVKRHQEMMADEGLAYSIGNAEGTPYVEYVASRIGDPAIAAQLRRLHNNALANNSTGNLLRSPMEDFKDMQRMPKPERAWSLPEISR